MRLPTPTSSARPVLLAALVFAGNASAFGQSRRPASASGVGDTAAFGFRMTAITPGPERVTYELARPAYVTMIAVTETTIEPLMPLVSEEPRIIMAGGHTTGLNRGRESMPGTRTGAPVSDPRVAELQAYNQCMNRAIQLDKGRREASRPIIGRDSAGRPIYGPPNPAVEVERSYESMCKLPAASSHEGTTEQARPAHKNRYLLVYVSDSPVRHESIVALTVSENEPRLFTMSIGRKLFGGRDAIWAGYYRPW